MGLAIPLSAAAEPGAPCPGHPGALGTSRVLAVDAATTPRVGRKHFPSTLPLADKEVVLIVIRYVVRMANAAKPTVNIFGDQLRVQWRGDMAATEDVIALACWLDPERVIDAITRELPQRPGALPRDERLKQTALLESELDKLERSEEGLIQRAHSDGLADVLRRVDASPAAVLGVVVAQAKAAVA
jgi:hypothetical protein